MFIILLSIGFQYIIDISSLIPYMTLIKNVKMVIIYCINFI
jgi:hypothetical protein